MKVPGGENTLISPARIRRAADDLHGSATVAGVDHVDAQPIRIRCCSAEITRDGKRRQRLRLVLDVLDLEPDHGEPVGELFQRLVGVEMFLQPGEVNFTSSAPPRQRRDVERLEAIMREPKRTSLSNSRRRSGYACISAIAMRSITAHLQVKPQVRHQDSMPQARSTFALHHAAAENLQPVLCLGPKRISPLSRRHWMSTSSDGSVNGKNEAGSAC